MSALWACRALVSHQHFQNTAAYAAVICCCHLAKRQLQMDRLAPTVYSSLLRAGKVTLLNTSLAIKEGILIHDEHLYECINGHCPLQQQQPGRL